MQFFLELQISAAFADGDIHPSERSVLHKIAQGLGFSSQQLEQRLKMQEAAFAFNKEEALVGILLVGNREVLAAVGNKIHSQPA